MDQGAAAVWASAVAGFSSATGAALGSMLAGRTARDQADRTVQREKVTRQETAVDECFADFRKKVWDALAVIHEASYALKDESSVSIEPLNKASAAVRASYMGLFSTGKVNVAHAGEVVCTRLELTLVPIRALIGNRDAAKDPNSQGMQALGTCFGNLQSAWQNYCRLLDEAIRIR